MSGKRGARAPLASRFHARSLLWVRTRPPPQHGPGPRPRTGQLARRAVPQALPCTCRPSRGRAGRGLPRRIRFPDTHIRSQTVAAAHSLSLQHKKNAPISEVAPPGGRPRWPCRTGMGGWGCGRGEGRACEERARAPSAGPFKRRRGGRARPSALVLPARPAPGGPAWPLAPGSAAAPPPSPCRRRSAARRPRRRPAWRGCVEREGESVSKQASKKKPMRPSARRPPAPASLHLPLSPGLVVRLAARARPGGAGGGHGETRGVCVGRGVRAAAAGERAL